MSTLCRCPDPWLLACILAEQRGEPRAAIRPDDLGGSNIIYDVILNLLYQETNEFPSIPDAIHRVDAELVT